MRYGKSKGISAWLIGCLLCLFLPYTLNASDTPSQVRSTAWGDVVYSKNNALYRFQQDGDDPLIYSPNKFQINDFHLRGEQLLLATQQGLVSYFNGNTSVLYGNPIAQIEQTPFGVYVSSSQAILKLGGNEVTQAISFNRTIDKFAPVSANQFWLASNTALTLWDITLNKEISRISIPSNVSQLVYSDKSELFVLINNKLFKHSEGTLTPVSKRINHLLITKFAVVDNVLLLQTSKGLLRFSLIDNDFIAPPESGVTFFYLLDNAQTFILHSDNSFTLANHSGLVRERFFQIHPVAKLFDDMALAKPIQIEQQQDKSYLALNENGLWRVDATTNRIKNVFEHTFLRGFYVQNTHHVWFYDHHRIFKYSLLQQRVIEQISQPNISALVGDGYYEPIVIVANQTMQTRAEQRLERVALSFEVGAVTTAKQVGSAVYIGSKQGIWRYALDSKQLVRISALPITGAEKLNENSLLISSSIGNYILDTNARKLSYINGLISPDSFFIKEVNATILHLNDVYLRFSGQFSHSAISWQALKEQHLLGEEASLYQKTPLLFHVTATPDTGVLFEVKSKHDQAWQPLTNQVHMAIYDSLADYTHIRNAYGLHQQQLTLPKSHETIENTLHYAVLVSLGLLALICILLLFSKHLKHAVTKSLLSLTEEAVWIADSNLNVIEINDKFTQITGLAKEQVVGKQLKIYSHFKRNKKLELQIINSLHEKGYWKGEFSSTNKQGDNSFFAQSIERISHPWFPFGHHRYLGLVTDITARKQQELALKDLATRDQNTGLINRTMLVESIMQAIESANNEHPEFCLLLLNIDNFYKINEELGHSQGNFLLRLVADRLKQSLPSAYILSCLGGNDFAILVPPFQYKRASLFGINKLCQEIQLHLQTTFHILNTPISLTACIGISLYPDNGFDSESLMANAESALHYAKELGPNNYQFYKRTIKKRIKSSLSIENEIVQAIENNDFILYYQPKFNINTQQIVGAEALVRWPDNQGNIRPPSYFIDICEQNNSIVPLTKNLLEIACKQLVSWRAQGISLNGPLALNMSAVHFQNNELAQELSLLLSKYQLDPSLLELEITETVMMKSPEFAQKQMERIKSLGINIALDDFGVGHSSLNYLKHFPIDKLKIDRSFIMDIEHSTQGLNITATIIRLAKYLGLEVVAEGVETQQQAYLLNGMGCPVIQGFYYSKPLPVNQLESLLTQQQKLVKSRD